MKALISCLILFTFVIICFADTETKRPKRDSFTGGSFFNEGGNYHEMVGIPGQAPPRYVDLTPGQGGIMDGKGQGNNFGGQPNQGFGNGGSFADQGLGNNGQAPSRHGSFAGGSFFNQGGNYHEMLGRPGQAPPRYVDLTPGQGGQRDGKGQGNTFGGQPNQGFNQQGLGNNGQASSRHGSFAGGSFFNQGGQRDGKGQGNTSGGQPHQGSNQQGLGNNGQAPSRHGSFAGRSFFNQGGNYHEMHGRPGQAPPRHVDLTPGQGGKMDGKGNTSGGQPHQGSNQQGRGNDGSG